MGMRFLNIIFPVCIDWDKENIIIKEDLFMKIGKLILYSVAVAVLAGVVVLITDLLQMAGFVAGSASMTFITFICWASYFLVGATPKAAGKAFLGFFAGIVAAILMFLLVTAFAGGMDVLLLAIPLAVVVVVPFMCLLEKAGPFNNVAAVFAGTGMFFALMGVPDIAATGYIMVGIGQLVYALIGLAAGWATILIRVAIEKSASKSTDAGVSA